MAFTTQTAPTNNVTVLNAAYMNAFAANLASLRNGNDQYVKVYLDSNPSIANNTATILTWTTTAFQVGTIWDPAHPTRFNATLTGKWLLLINQEWRSNTANLRNISVLRSAGGAAQYDLQSQGAAGGKSNVSAKLVVSMTAGQYLEVRAFQSSGGALSLHGGSQDRTRAAMIFLGGDSGAGSWVDPADWALGTTPSSAQITQEMISNVLSLRNLNDLSIRLHRTAVQSMTNNVRLAINWQAAAYQTGLTWSSGTNPSRITVPVAGRYLLVANIKFANVVGSRRALGWRANGGSTANDIVLQPGNGVDTLNGLEWIDLAAGDYIEVYGFQNTGGAINTSGTTEGDCWVHLSLWSRTYAADPPVWKTPRVWVDGAPDGILSPAKLDTEVRDRVLNLQNMKGAGAIAYLVDDQSISQLQRDPITFQAASANVGGIWDGGAKFIAPVPGVYIPAISAQWDGIGSASAQGVGYRINETSTANDLQFQEGGANAAVQNGADLVQLAQDDALAFYAYQDSDESISLDGGADATRASVVLAAAPA